MIIKCNRIPANENNHKKEVKKNMSTNLNCASIIRQGVGLENDEKTDDKSIHDPNGIPDDTTPSIPPSFSALSHSHFSLLSSPLVVLHVIYVL